MTYFKKATVEFEPSNLSAFGTLETAELHPLVQMDFVYGINTQTGITTTANSATVDTTASKLRLQSGTNAAGSAIFHSRRAIKYRAGQGITARFTGIFAAGTDDNTQIIGCGDEVDGYFFGYNGTSFGICHRNNSSDTWVTQANWNSDKCDGTGASGFNWDTSKGNVMMIKYPYLGFGDINFFVLDGPQGRWILCHTIRYANTTTSTQLTNPNLFFYAQNLNSGNTTNLSMYVASVGIFLSGERSYIGNPKWSASSNKSAITTETNLLTLKNASSYNGVTNRSLIRLNSISIASSAANGVGTFYLKTGATLGGSPSYTAINGTTADGGVTITSGNSIASYDTAGTTVANGLLLFAFIVDNPNSTFIDLNPYNLFLAPGETLTLSSSSTNSSAMGIAINWSEDI